MKVFKAAVVCHGINCTPTPISIQSQAYVYQRGDWLKDGAESTINHTSPRGPIPLCKSEPRSNKKCRVKIYLDVMADIEYNIAVHFSCCGCFPKMLPMTLSHSFHLSLYYSYLVLISNLKNAQLNSIKCK